MGGGGKCGPRAQAGVLEQRQAEDGRQHDAKDGEAVEQIPPVAPVVRAVACPRVKLGDELGERVDEQRVERRRRLAARPRKEGGGGEAEVRDAGEQVKGALDQREGVEPAPTRGEGDGGAPLAVVRVERVEVVDAEGHDLKREDGADGREQQLQPQPRRRDVREQLHTAAAAIRRRPPPSPHLVRHGGTPSVRDEAAVSQLERQVQQREPRAPGAPRVVNGPDVDRSSRRRPDICRPRGYGMPSHSCARRQ